MTFSPFGIFPIFGDFHGRPFGQPGTFPEKWETPHFANPSLVPFSQSGIAIALTSLKALKSRKLGKSWPKVEKIKNYFSLIFLSCQFCFRFWISVFFFLFCSWPPWQRLPLFTPNLCQWETTRQNLGPAEATLETEED